MVQEAFVRWQSADRSAIDVPAAWLTMVVTNLSLNRFTSAVKQREEYVGVWLPEPILDRADPSDRVSGQENAFVVQHAPGAEELRTHLTTFQTEDRVVIVGGGRTGVEMASELAESRRELRVHLVSENAIGYWLSRRGQRYLNTVFSGLKIETTSHAAVTEVGPDSVTLKTGETLTSAATMWTAGFSIHHLAAKAEIDTTELGRIRVGPDLQSLSHPDVYAIGDAASWTLNKTNLEVPMVCGTAVPMAVIAARSIVNNLHETTRRPAQLRSDYLLQHISLVRRRGIV